MGFGVRDAQAAARGTQALGETGRRWQAPRRTSGGGRQRQYNCKSRSKMDLDAQKTKSHSNQSTVLLEERECPRPVPLRTADATLAACSQPPWPHCPASGHRHRGGVSWGLQVREGQRPVCSDGREAPWGQDPQVSLRRAGPSCHTKGCCGHWQAPWSRQEWQGPA